MIGDISVRNFHLMEIAKLRNEQFDHIQAVHIRKGLAIFSDKLIKPDMARRKLIDFAVLGRHLVFLKTRQRPQAVIIQVTILVIDVL